MLFLIILLLIAIVVVVRPGLLSNTIALVLFICVCAWGAVVVYEDVNWVGIKNAVVILVWIATSICCMVLIARMVSAIGARKETRQRYQVGDGKPDAGAFDQEKKSAARMLRAFTRYLVSYTSSLLASRDPAIKQDPIKLEVEKVSAPPLSEKKNGSSLQSKKS
jgi:type VI protein secretion system component VasK